MDRSVGNLAFGVKQYLALHVLPTYYKSSNTGAYCMAILPGSRSDVNEKEILENSLLPHSIITQHVDNPRKNIFVPFTPILLNPMTKILHQISVYDY